MQKWLACTAIVLLLVVMPSRGMAQEPSSQPVFTAIQMVNANEGWGGVEIPTTQSQKGTHQAQYDQYGVGIPQRTIGPITP